VLGQGPIRRFARLAREFGVEGRVSFVGRRHDIQRFYGAADLFLLPTTYEPFPNVNLEAMACGTPVVTTRTAGGADLVRPGCNGYLVSNADAVDEILLCLDLHFLRSEGERHAMSSACWEVARQLTLEHNVRQTLEVFEEVLLEKSRV
jgi:UDP-glucose:(heptosyl)LPS alpha-1,3-glucosyltransferase